MADIARLGLAVDSSQVEKGTATLHQLTGAAGQASAAAQRLAGATQAEAAGHKSAAAAAQVHNAALMAQNTVIRSSMQQRTMMIYQLNDVAVSLASGMNPAMVAMQQGSQILQGGFAPALRTITDLAKGFLVTFWPVAAAVGAASLAVAGLTYEINKTSDVQVGFFDVALAGWQLFAEGVTALVAPVFGAIGSWLQKGWDAAAPILKAIGNTLIGTFVGAFEAVKATWSMLPAAIGDLVYQAAEGAVNGVIYMIRSVQEQINRFISTINTGLASVGSSVRVGGRMDLLDYADISNPYAGAAGAAGSTAADAFAGAQGDYMGAAFDAWSARAQKIAAAKKEVEGLGGAAAAANDNAKKLAGEGLSSVADKAFDVAKGLGQAFQGVGSGIMDAAKNAKSAGDFLGGVFDMLIEKVGKFASSWLDNIINNGLNSLFGGFGGFGMGSGLAGTSSVTGSSGGFFPGFPSMDGGGYTGSGSRSGGLDGKGGFMAMLHPRETVIDHTRPANSNQPINVQTNIINNAGVEVQENTYDDGSGGIRQEIVLNRAIASQIAKPGPAQKAVMGTGRLVRR